jgi:hypothetical protein
LIAQQERFRNEEEFQDWLWRFEASERFIGFGGGSVCIETAATTPTPKGTR